MNRFAAAGLIAEAEQGKTVLVVSEGWNHSRHAFLNFEPLATTATRIVRAAGTQRIDYPSGGCVRFTSARSQPAGVVADIVFIDWDAETANPMVTEVYRPCIATSPRGEIVRA